MDKKYETIFKKFATLIDNESAHIAQDKIYRKFIGDICKGNLTPKYIAKDINNMSIKIAGILNLCNKCNLWIKNSFFSCVCF